MALAWLGEESGVRVEVPDVFTPVPPMQSAQVPVVGAVSPWTWPDVFRPNLSVATAGLTPERCTLEQHLALTVAEQLALGVHVTAVDLWPGPDDEPGFRVIGVVAGLGTTIVQLQWLAVRSGTVVTLGMQQPADKYAAALPIFTHAVRTLRVLPGSTLVDPDPATVPRSDPFAGSRGQDLVDLSRIAAAEPWEGTGPTLGAEQLAGLHEGRIPKPLVDQSLLDADLCTPRGRLTDAGTLLHTTMEQPSRTVVLEATAGSARRATMHAYLRPSGAVVVATPPVGAAGEGFRVGLVPPAGVAVDLVRWLSLSPAWTFSLSAAADGCLELPAEQLSARIGDAATPVPDAADDAGARLWTSPWTVCTVRGSLDPDGLLLVSTPAAGWFRLHAPETGTARIEPLPSETVLRLLLTIAGFDTTS